MNIYIRVYICIDIYRDILFCKLDISSETINHLSISLYLLLHFKHEKWSDNRLIIVSRKVNLLEVITSNQCLTVK